MERNRWKLESSVPIILAAIAMSGLSHEASAKEYYTGAVVGECATHQGAQYNVVATVTAPNWYVSELDYLFVPAAAQSKTTDVDGKTRYFFVTPGSYTVHVGNVGFSVGGTGYQAKYAITVPDCTPPRKGLTWKLISANPSNGTVRVGCGNGCDARNGDTVCTTPLPILCIRKTGAGFPLPVPASVNDTNRYNRWSGGVIATTAPVVPPAKRADANALCGSEFGPGWRVAEHHDGWGWAFQAYGGTGDPSARFWVDINDTQGNCWQ